MLTIYKFNNMQYVLICVPILSYIIFTTVMHYHIYTCINSLISSTPYTLLNHVTFGSKLAVCT